MSERRPRDRAARRAGRRRVERGERLDHVQRQPGGGGDFLRGRLPLQLLAQLLGAADDAGEICGAVERHPDGAALPGQRGEDGLADPPDGVGDELDALVGVELPGRGEEPDVAFADQIGEREPAVLVFLGDRDDEAEVPFTSSCIASGSPARTRRAMAISCGW